MNSAEKLQPRVRMVTLGLTATVLAAGVWILPACSAQGGAQATGGASEVLATVGADKVTRGEIETAAKEGLDQAEMQKLQCESNYQRSVHQVMESTLQRVVRDRLVDDEAKARQISRDELLQQEVQSKLTEVTQEEVDKFYNENQAQIRQPKERVEAQVRQHLARLQAEAANNTFIESLEAKAKVNYVLGPYRVEVAATGPGKGKENAPITIVEFSDFQCPYCSRVVPTMKQVEEKYGDKVRVVFRHFPLNFHQQAQKAAEASICAHDQGKFWEMHDLLFEEQQKLQIADLKDKAQRLGLDTAKFDECLDSGKHYEAVQKDLKEGVVAGVSGTPAMYINGQFLSGAQPFEAVAQIIDAELKRLNVN